MKYLKIFLPASVFLCFCFPNIGLSQEKKIKTWCTSLSKTAKDEKANTKKLFMEMRNPDRSISASRSFGSKTFPLRIGVINSLGTVENEMKNRVKNAINILNEGFEKVNINFELETLEGIQSDLKIEDLTPNAYDPYTKFSTEHDKKDMISVFIFDYDPYLCETTQSSIRCSRTGGFSYILSEATNNIVISEFDVDDHKVIVHEMAHIFGLYHTFEEATFGKDDFAGDCNILGDCLCDTPQDPGPAYEVYVNYSLCSMKGFMDENNNKYNPLINNYMAYFKPCYLTPYSFTQGQIDYLSYAARSDFRKHFAK